MSFKLKVKNGDSAYEWNEKTNHYESGDKDLVEEYETLGTALFGFLEWVQDADLDTKVSLSFLPKNVETGKKGKKGKK